MDLPEWYFILRDSHPSLMQGKYVFLFISFFNFTYIYIYIYIYINKALETFFIYNLYIFLFVLIV